MFDFVTHFDFILFIIAFSFAGFSTNFPKANDRSVKKTAFDTGIIVVRPVVPPRLVPIRKKKKLLLNFQTIILYLKMIINSILILV